MPIRALLAAAALTLATPAGVLAQAPTAPAVPQAAPTEAEAAFEARGARFSEQMEQMGREIDAAVRAGGEPEAVLAAVDEILARHRPETDGFADALDAFLASQAEQAADPETKAQLTAARDTAVPVIRAIPDQLRAGVEQALSQADAAAGPETNPGA